MCCLARTRASRVLMLVAAVSKNNAKCSATDQDQCSRFTKKLDQQQLDALQRILSKVTTATTNKTPKLCRMALLSDDEEDFLDKIAHAGTPSPTHATPKKQRLNSSSSDPDSPNHALHRRLVASSPTMTSPRASRLLDPFSPMPSGSRRSQAPDHEIR